MIDWSLFVAACTLIASLVLQLGSAIVSLPTGQGLPGPIPWIFEVKISLGPTSKNFVGIELD